MFSSYLWAGGFVEDDLCPGSGLVSRLKQLNKPADCVCLHDWSTSKASEEGEALNGTHISGVFCTQDHCCGLLAAVYGKTWRQVFLPPCSCCADTWCGQTCKLSALRSSLIGTKWKSKLGQHFSVGFWTNSVSSLWLAVEGLNPVASELTRSTKSQLKNLRAWLWFWTWFLAPLKRREKPNRSFKAVIICYVF